MIAAIGGELTEDEAAVPTEVSGVRLAENVVLMTYVTDRRGQPARRSSLWRRADDGSWRVYFHQGTPIPAE